MDKAEIELFQQLTQLWKEKSYTDIVEILQDKTLEKFHNANFYAFKARACARVGKIEQCLIHAQKAIDINPQLAAGYIARGNAMYHNKDYDQAISDYNTAIALDENDSYYYYNRGLVLLIQKKHDKAIEDFNMAILLDNSNASAYISRGNAWEAKNELEKAFEDYNKSVLIDKNNPLGYLNRGKAWNTQKKYEKAISDFNKAIRLDQKNPLFYYNRGKSYFYRNQFERAIQDFNRALAIDKSSANSYLARGNSFYNQNKFDKAIEDYNKSIELSEGSANPFYNRALVYSQLEKYDLAVKDYKRYVELANNTNDYFTEIAIAEIKNLTKKIENDWYEEIDTIILEVKNMLLFTEQYITHYTSLSGARAMILENSSFRLSEGTFLNDTSEGRELFKYLSLSNAKQMEDDTISEVFVERPFIGSFVADNKHDDLTLWRMYGKEAQAEAKGCSLTIHRESFLKNIAFSLNPIDNGLSDISQQERKFTFYKVAYRSKNIFSIPGTSDKINRRFNKLLTELKAKLLKLNEKQLNSASKLLNDIAYLFKSTEYQYENEVRLVVQEVGFRKNIDTKIIPPKVYIELIKLVPVLKKITLGPKVERADEWAAAFNYHIKDSKERTLVLSTEDNKVEIIISHLPFK